MTWISVLFSSLYPGDLYAFTRRPTFLIVDSDNSSAFAAVPQHFEQPLVVLMSPTDVPSTFRGELILFVPDYDPLCPWKSDTCKPCQIVSLLYASKVEILPQKPIDKGFQKPSSSNLTKKAWLRQGLLISEMMTTVEKGVKWKPKYQ